MAQGYFVALSIQDLNATRYTEYGAVHRLWPLADGNIVIDTSTVLIVQIIADPPENCPEQGGRVATLALKGKHSYNIHW